MHSSQTSLCQVRAIEAFIPAQEHVGMLLRGEVAEFVELVLGTVAAEAVDDVVRGLQNTLGGAARALFERAVERLGILREDRDHLVSLLVPMITEDQLRRLRAGGDIVATLRELAEGAADAAGRLPVIVGRALIAATLVGKLRLPPALAAEVAGELVQTAAAGDLTAVVSEPARALAMLQDWAASPACEQRMEEITSAVKQMLRSLVEARIESERSGPPWGG
jgi:hypothetical protein